MKTKFFFSLLLLLGTFVSFANIGHGAFVEEKEIPTKDGSCSIRYLTNKNVKGWYVDADEISCTEDGWIDGYHDLTLYNAFSKPIEQIYGYFSYGYWTGTTFVKSPFLTSFTEETGDQKATFLLARDSTYQLDYIGQMIAKKDSMDSYGSFQVCNPFRLLVVTENIPVFADKKKQRLIFKNIEKQVRSLCPSEEKVMLFLSPVVEPRQEDIVFYAEMDLKNNTQKTKWQEEALKQSGYYEKTVEAATLSNIVSPNVKDLEVLRKTIAKKINLIPFKKQESNETISFDEEEKPTTPAVKRSQVSFKEEVEADVEEDVLTETDDAFQEPKFLIPEPNKNYQHEQPMLNPDKHEPIMHLCILSKIKQDTVPFANIVHIQDNKEDESYTDMPLPLKIKGHALKPGWYKISGLIDATLQDDGYTATIIPNTVQNHTPGESDK